MNTRLRRIVGCACIAVGLCSIASAVADDYAVPFEDLRTLLTPDRFKSAGLDKLTVSELTYLDTLLQFFRQETSKQRYGKGYSDGYSAVALLPKFDVNGLGGIKTVSVAVSAFNPDVLNMQGFVIDSGQVKTETELKMQQSGIHLGDHYLSDGVLHVNVNLLRNGENEVVYSVSEDLEQFAVLSRNRSIATTGITWRDPGVIGFAGKNVMNGAIDKAISDSTDRFLNEYLKANPKP